MSVESAERNRKGNRRLARFLAFILPKCILSGKIYHGAESGKRSQKTSWIHNRKYRRMPPLDSRRDINKAESNVVASYARCSVAAALSSPETWLYDSGVKDKAVRLNPFTPLPRHLVNLCLCLWPLLPGSPDIEDVTRSVCQHSASTSEDTVYPSMVMSLEDPTQSGKQCDKVLTTSVGVAVQNVEDDSGDECIFTSNLYQGPLYVDITKSHVGTSNIIHLPTQFESLVRCQIPKSHCYQVLMASKDEHTKISRT